MGKAPLTHVFELSVAANASGATLVTPVGVAPFTGSVVEVLYAPSANITGADTHSRTFSLINKGLDGNGAVAAATLANVSGVNFLDFDAKAITLNANATGVAVAEGDVLVWSSAHVGNGLADPGGLVTVELSRTP